MNASNEESTEPPLQTAYLKGERKKRKMLVSEACVNMKQSMLTCTRDHHEPAHSFLPEGKGRIKPKTTCEENQMRRERREERDLGVQELSDFLLESISKSWHCGDSSRSEHSACETMTRR
jgi:hypothetical protein